MLTASTNLVGKVVTYKNRDHVVTTVVHTSTGFVLLLLDVHGGLVEVMARECTVRAP